jgi:hypothetical protein
MFIWLTCVREIAQMKPFQNIIWHIYNFWVCRFYFILLFARLVARLCCAVCALALSAYFSCLCIWFDFVDFYNFFFRVSSPLTLCMPCTNSINDDDDRPHKYAHTFSHVFSHFSPCECVWDQAEMSKHHMTMAMMKNEPFFSAALTWWSRKGQKI